MIRFPIWTAVAAIALLTRCGGSEAPPAAPPTPPSAPPGAAAERAVPPAAEPAAPPAGESPDAAFARVHDYTRQFYAGELADLHARFSDEFKSSFPLEQLAALRRRVAEEYGKETAVLGEETAVKGEYRGFARFARFEKSAEPIEVQWILRNDDSIAGLFVRPAQRTGAPRKGATP